MARILAIERLYVNKRRLSSLCFLLHSDLVTISKLWSLLCVYRWYANC